MSLATIKGNALSKNILVSALIKGVNIIFVILIVKRSISVLGVENFGIWTAITSISTWISLLDIGIGNGLRVELRRCFLEKDWKSARTLLNTAYLFMFLLSIVVIIVFFIFWQQTDWAAFFNIKNYSVKDVNILVLLTVVGLVCQLIFSLLQPVLTANLDSGLQGFFLALANGLVLIYLFLVNEHTVNIVQYGFLNAFLPPLVYLGFSLYYYKTRVPELMPNFKETDFKKLHPILLVSGKFFIMQISSVLMYQMTSFLLIRYSSPIEVAEYNVSFRYFNLFNIIFMTLLSPLWSLTTDAFLRDDLAWVIKTVKKYLGLLLLIYVALIFGYFMRDFVFKIWLDNVSVTPKIALYVAFYMAILSWNMVFLYVVTGAGKINLQFILAIITMIIFFPLTHFLVKTLNWGIDGIFIGNILILLMTSFSVPLQAYYVLKTKNQSYWLS
jgi:O-antigen/teichoic acid export membrane protein